MDTEQRRHGPPFDGKPCPACPTEIRGLTATVRNMLARWDAWGQHGDCESRDHLARKVKEMRDALADAQPFVDAHFADEMHAFGHVLAAAPREPAHVGLPLHGGGKGLTESLREREHEWQFVLRKDDGQSVDTVDVCLACGTARHAYAFRGEVRPGYPRYFGNRQAHHLMAGFWNTTEELPCRVTEEW